MEVPPNKWWRTILKGIPWDVWLRLRLPQSQLFLRRFLISRRCWYSC
jgi:hypothetical protein